MTGILKNSWNEIYPAAEDNSVSPTVQCETAAIPNTNYGIFLAQFQNPAIDKML